MGEQSDGSSNAAHGALPQTLTNTDTQDSEPRRGFWSRLLGKDTPAPVVHTARVETTDNSARPTHGMINLRRMRVEDVAIPKAEIVAVPANV
ncbi:MAG: magnesium/cobalt efflux protein, partial [Pseudomonadota bacterium]|nr:magnesium/cobalt efflux protein [Pseudomonadota bacterium]